MPQKKKERNLSAMTMNKKGMFCEIDLHGKVLPKCQSWVDGGCRKVEKGNKGKNRNNLWSSSFPCTDRYVISVLLQRRQM